MRLRLVLLEMLCVLLDGLSNSLLDIQRILLGGFANNVVGIFLPLLRFLFRCQLGNDYKVFLQRLQHKSLLCCGRVRYRCV